MNMIRRKLIVAFGALAFATVAASPALADKPATYQSGGVAINGYDPVAYFTQRKPVKGDARFAHKYRGATYHFSSARNLATFKRAPAKYAPQYGGYCAFGLGFANKLFPTDPAAFTIHNGKLYLNVNKSIQARWTKKKDAFIKQADVNAKKSYPQLVQ